MSDAYIKSILRYCVAIMCKKVGVEKSSSQVIALLVDLTYDQIKENARLLYKKQAEHRDRQLSDIEVLSIFLPNSNKRKYELKLLTQIMLNCKNNKPINTYIHHIPLQVNPLYEQSMIAIDINNPPHIQQTHFPIASSPDCLWGGGGSNSKLFEASNTHAIKPKFATVTNRKRFQTIKTKPIKKTK